MSTGEHRRTPANTGDPGQVDDATIASAATDAPAAVLDRLRGQARWHRPHTSRHERNSGQPRNPAIRRKLTQVEHTAEALRTNLETHRARPVKHALIGLSERYRAPMAARSGYRHIVNTLGGGASLVPAGTGPTGGLCWHQ